MENQMQLNAVLNIPAARESGSSLDLRPLDIV